MWGGDGDVKKCLICPSVGYILDHVESGHFSGYLPGFLDQKKAAHSTADNKTNNDATY